MANILFRPAFLSKLAKRLSPAETKPSDAGSRGRYVSFLSSRRDSNWIACIDFGTALSKVAMVAAMDSEELQPNDIKPLYLVDTPGQKSFLLPSVIFVTDGHLLFGGEADQATI